MKMSGRDPEGALWGLYDLMDISYPNTDSHGRHENSAREGDQEADCPDVQNDEAIALILQEEYKRLADAVESGYGDDDGKEQESFIAQDCRGHSRKHSASVSKGNEDNKKSTDDFSNQVEGTDDHGAKDMGEEYDSSNNKNKETDQRGSCNVCPIPAAEESRFTKSMSHSLDVNNDSACDDEVGNSLSQMVPTPHLPGINTDISSTNEKKSDHQRLLGRLQHYGMVERLVKGDGNCQFRALSDQLYGSTEHHILLRKKIIEQLRSHQQMYEAYVSMPYVKYLKKMSRYGEWGDNVTLQAASDLFGVKIYVITSFRDTSCIEILPEFQKSTQDIYLSFWAELHYNSVYPEGDQLASHLKKRKWWDPRD